MPLSIMYTMMISIGIRWGKFVKSHIRLVEQEKAD